MIITTKAHDNKKMAREYIEKISDNIYFFIKELGINYITFQQKQLFDAAQQFRLNPKHRNEDFKSLICCRSGQGPGKTFSSAIIGTWFVLGGSNSKLIVTGPGMAQCKDVWLAQAKKLIQYNDDCSTIIKALFDFSETGFGIVGRKQNVWGGMLKASKDGDAARGQHEENMLIIVEEASGLAPDMWEVYKGTLTSPSNFMIAIGNPSRRASGFYDLFYGPNNADYLKLHWDAEKTPESKYFTFTKNERMAREYGRDSDIYRVNVLGEFPKQDSDTVLSDSMLYPLVFGENSSQLRQLRYLTEPSTIIPDARSYDEIIEDARKEAPHDFILRRQFGIDYARMGGDENVVYQVQGGATVGWWIKSMVEPLEATDWAIERAKSSKWTQDNCQFVPDASGIGQGCLGRISEKGYSFFAFHNHGRPFSSEYHDRITEAYFWLRKKVVAGKVSIPDDPVLIRQLSQRRYSVDSKGKLAMIPKDQHRREHGESPDRADAFVMAFYPAPPGGGLDVITS